MVIETLKKFAVGDMPPSPTTSNPISSNSNSHKKPTRHHYKRRSSGRIHVTKLAPMAKAHAQQQSATEGDNETNSDDDKDGHFVDLNQQTQRHQQLAPRKPMKRTQSSKSIHRLSSIDPQRKVNLSGFTMTSKSAAANSSPQNAPHVSPPITPTDQQFQQTQPDPPTEQSIYDSIRDHIESPVTAPLIPSTCKLKFTTSPSFQVSHQATAAPIANTMNATAKTFVAPDTPALANLTTPTNTATLSSIATASTISPNHDENNKAMSKKKHLCSRFVRHGAPQNQHLAQTSNNDIFSADHMIPLTMGIFTFGDLDNEYQYIQTYQDPMIQSLTRCMKQRQERRLATVTTTATTTRSTQSTQSQLQRLVQRGAQQRTFSSSILPTMSTLASLSSTAPAESTLLRSPSYDNKQQHPEHRTLARQRYQRLQAVYASSSLSTHHHHHQYHHSSPVPTFSDTNKQSPSRWSAGALLGRVFYGAP